MHPILFTWQGRALSSYGMLIGLGVLLGAAVASRLHRPSTELSRNDLLDACFYALIGGFLGARVAFVLLQAGDFWARCAEPAPSVWAKLTACMAPLAVWEGGLVYQGGLAGGLLATWWLAKRRNLSLGRLADALIPGVAVGHILGRLGCLGVGCCYGKPTGLPWGLAFAEGSVAYAEGFGGVHLHPTQLYEATLETALLVWLIVKMRSTKLPPGGLTLRYVLGYTLIRFFVEMLRGDPARGFVFRLPATWPIVLSVPQAVCLVVLGLLVTKKARKLLTGGRADAR